MAEKIFGIFSVLALVFFLIGIGASIHAICSEFGPVQRWRRERRPETVRDSIAQEIIRSLTREPGGWAVHYGAAGFGDTFEKIVRNDGRITVKGYKEQGNFEYLTVIAAGVGEFRGFDFKPSLAKDLKQAGLAFKDYCAIGTLLNPERFLLEID